MLLSEAIEIFFDNNTFSPLTVRNYQKAFDKFLSFTDKEIEDITIRDITDFEQTLNRSTKYLYLMTLRSLFRFCQLKYDIDCLDYRKIDPQRSPVKSWSNLSEANIHLILNNFKISRTDLRDKALIHTLYSTGCRSAEALSMKINDIDFINGSCEILGKGGKYRTVYFTKDCLKDLKSYLDSRNDDCPYLFVATETYGNNPPRQMSSSNLRMSFYRLSKELGFKIHSHQFRKSFATELYRQSNDIYKVSKLCGHSNVETTQRYAIVENEELKEFHQRNMGKNREFILQEKESGRVKWEIKGFVAEGYSKTKIVKAIKKAMDEAI